VLVIEVLLAFVQGPKYDDCGHDEQQEEIIVLEN
jgi:hypothetical protein